MNNSNITTNCDFKKQGSKLQWAIIEWFASFTLFTPEKNYYEVAYDYSHFPE